MSTPVTNFGKVTVSTTYDAAATSIVLTTGHGSRLPSTFPYPLVWWNFTDYPDPADDPNKEIVTVTARTGDTLTVTRNAESSGASTKNTAAKTYKMALTITKAMWDALATQNLPQTFRGLQLRTHPDNDVAASKTVFSADVIVMSDGQAVSSWSNVVTDLAASGAQGLDTGSEANSVWYEQYAIYNGTNKYGCLHRSKDWLLDVDVTASITEDATQGIRSAVDNSTVRVSQGVTPATSGKLVFIDVELIKVGSPTGNIWFTIEANSGGVPSNTPLATSWKFDVSKIPTTAGGTAMRIPFMTPYSVSASTIYHIVAYGDWTVSATDYIGWRMDGSAAGYTGGSKALFDSDTSTWTADTDDDMMLKIYIERNNVDFSTTVPSGYTYALIGYCYNDSGGNLVAFVQQDRIWRHIRPQPNGLLVNETSSALVLNDLRSSIPAKETLNVTLGLTGTGAASAALTLGSITLTDLVYNTANVGHLVTIYSTIGSEALGDAKAVQLSYAAVYTDGTAGADLYMLGFNW